MHYACLTTKEWQRECTYRKAGLAKERRNQTSKS